MSRSSSRFALCSMVRLFSSSFRAPLDMLTRHVQLGRLKLSVMGMACAPRRTDPTGVVRLSANAYLRSAKPRDGRDLHMLDIIISIFTDPGFAKGFFAGAIQQIQEIVGPWS